MKELYDILSEFKTMKEYSDFMDTLIEKTTSGNEISRGMSKHDKSKQEKKDNATYVSKEVNKGADGSATETHYDQTDPSIGAMPEEPPVPLQPGAQVKIGNKQIDQAQIAPTTVEIKLSGDQDKLEMKPKVDKDPNNFPR